jgi:hypothetical protein
MSLSGTVRNENVRRIITILETAGKPLTFLQLKNKVGLDDIELKNSLEEAIKECAVFRWPDYKRSQYFSRQSPNEAAKRAILEIASSEALSGSHLADKARKRIPGLLRRTTERIVADLVAGSELRQVPAFTRGKLIILPGNAETYMASAQKFIQEKFRKAGLDIGPPFAPLSSTVIPAAPAPTVDAADQIMEALRALEPAPGVPVSAERVRARLPGISKHDLDAAAVELRKSQLVFLSAYDSPHGVSQKDRDVLIDGGDGSYYVAIAIR